MDFESGAIDATDVIGDGLELIRSNYWMYVLMTVVLGVCMIAMWFITSIINQAILTGLTLGLSAAHPDDATAGVGFIAIQGVSMGINLLISIVTGTLSAALICGMFKALARTARDGSFEFGDLFSGFQHLKACFIANLINVAIQTVLTLVVGGVAVGSIIGVAGIGIFEKNNLGRNPEILSALAPALILIFIVFFVVMVMFAVINLFVYPLVARGYSGSDSYLASIRAGFANFGGAFLLLFLSGLMILAAAIPCGLGLPFVFPIVYAAYFRATERVFGPEARPADSMPPTPDQYGFNSGY